MVKFRRLFDMVVHFGLPDARAREELIVQNLRSLDHEILQEDYRELVRMSEGHTGDDIGRLIADLNDELLYDLISAKSFYLVRAHP